MFETGVRDQGSQILHTAPPGVKSRSLALAFLLALEIGNDQAPPWFEHTGDFSESLTFEAIRQMMHHQGREHYIERLIGEGEMLDHPDLEIDGQVAPSRLIAGAGDLLCTWVNADDIPHVVAEKDGKFRSPALDTDDKFSQTFSTTGTVEYFCAIHPHMTGKIVVTP